MTIDIVDSASCQQVTETCTGSLSNADSRGGGNDGAHHWQDVKQRL